ncbi:MULTISPECIES: hypothetical protein [unclassified Curtobacterium]|nr:MULTISPECIES: hypothetical protein [unclassified Curtobacterium]WIB34794.1 hypothetical protein DEJ15_09450 [Curtobacterium sp. MCJR17_043]
MTEEQMIELKKKLADYLNSYPGAENAEVVDGDILLTVDDVDMVVDLELI